MCACVLVKALCSVLHILPRLQRWSASSGWHAVKHLRKQWFARFTYLCLFVRQSCRKRSEALTLCPVIPTSFLASETSQLAGVAAGAKQPNFTAAETRSQTFKRLFVLLRFYPHSSLSTSITFTVPPHYNFTQLNSDLRVRKKLCASSASVSEILNVSLCWQTQTLRGFWRKKTPPRLPQKLTG